MNLRLFTIVMLASALPLSARARGKGISLNRADFVSAREISQNGETLISAKLSKSGKAKFRRLSEENVNKVVHAEIAGLESNFKLIAQIKGSKLQMGPYTHVDAERVVSAINNK